VRRHHPFTTEAIVVLPDHLHALWTLPEGDADFAMRWRQIKPAFSRSLPTGELVSGSRGAKGERGIWQRRYREHTLMVGSCALSTLQSCTKRKNAARDWAAL